MNPGQATWISRSFFCALFLLVVEWLALIKLF
jgi:hypothetical protein